ncbi:MAG: hypothetical protein HYY16_05180 [Planctomycetes bacterium]|nr:hypothetical protein [Planctomycetota bacterium]
MFEKSPESVVTLRTEVRLARWILASLLAGTLVSCGDDGENGPVVQVVAGLGQGVVDPALRPPVGLTWYVRFNENVSSTVMTTWYSQLAGLSADLWNVSEGQVYLTHVVISDNHAAGARASQAYPASATASDMIVYSDTNWDIAPVLGFVTWVFGREGRFISIPETTAPETLIHEAAHLVFRLSWPSAPMLEDEYSDGQQDDACIMEGTFTPLRWCAADNHVEQTSQPTSCWQQILADHPWFTYAGTNTTTAPLPPMTVLYYNTP